MDRDPRWDLQQEEDDEQLAVALAQSQQDYDRKEGSATPASDNGIMEIISVHDDDDEVVVEEDWEMAVALQESVAAHQQQQQVDDNERTLEMIQVHQSVTDALQHQQSQRDAALAADMALEHTVRTSQEEADAQRSRQATAEPQPMCERDTGCWDCTQCTLRNAPYAPVCAACRVAAPPHVLTFHRVVPNVQFGVELELVVSDGVVDGYSCSWIAKELTRLGIPTSYVGYTHATTECWKVVTDASLSSSSRRDLCCEVVSPVLCGEKGIQSMRLLIETIRRIGIDVNTSCGFHVHVDAEPTSGLPAMATLRGLRRLSQCFVALERAFDALVGVKKRQANRNKCCQSNRLLFGDLSNKQRWRNIGTSNPINGLVHTVSPDRYRKLNLTNLINPSRPSTVEFRQHGGVDELLAAEAWVRLVLRFCEQTLCSSVEQLADMCCLHQNATEKDEVDALFQLLGCPGLRSYYTLDRRLYETLQQSWQCKVCNHCFRDSRSLAQHAQATRHHLAP